MSYYKKWLLLCYSSSTNSEIMRYLYVYVSIEFLKFRYTTIFQQKHSCVALISFRHCYGTYSLT